jgi:hypothetical protein
MWIVQSRLSLFSQLWRLLDEYLVCQARLMRGVAVKSYGGTFNATDSMIPMFDGKNPIFLSVKISHSVYLYLWQTGLW